MAFLPLFLGYRWSIPSAKKREIWSRNPAQVALPRAAKAKEEAGIRLIFSPPLLRGGPFVMSWMREDWKVNALHNVFEELLGRHWIQLSKSGLPSLIVISTHGWIKLKCTFLASWHITNFLLEGWAYPWFGSLSPLRRKDNATFRLNRFSITFVTTFA